VAVRALLDGERLPLEREGVRPLRLGEPPEQRVPIVLAALAPSSIRLAGELADGWLPFLWARSRLDDGRELLAEANDPTPTEVTPSVPLAIAADEATARQVAAAWLIAYVTRMGPIYPRTLRDRFGFADAVDALLEANADGGMPQLPAAAEELAGEVTVMATYDDAPQAIRQWLDAGADMVDLVLPLGLPEEQLSEMLEAAAPAAA
jgi:alkanesulfonate monooxygenase SsuD/methylene tetrahydromethanopterin reductase-like flavin-dependent oxidoreductase (luciferase family)